MLYFIGRIFGYEVANYTNNIIIIRKNKGSSVPKQFVGIYELIGEEHEECMKLRREMDLSNALINVRGKIITAKNSTITRASMLNPFDTLIVEKRRNLRGIKKTIVIKKGITAITKQQQTTVIIRIAKSYHNKKPIPLAPDTDWFEIIS
ncbi:hypothetical protein [Acidianus two-tailed virus 2]|nr:hypothetical protein [Acidianus two-tailed virus 2]